MNIAEASIRYKTVTVVMTLIVFAGGIYAYQGLGRLEDPEFTIKEAQVFTQYPGATAMEVAEEVTDEIETAVQQMGQLKMVTSISEPGLSTVRVEMKDRYDKDSLPQVWDELRRKVNDAQGSLPPGASSSVVYDDFGDVFGVFLAVYGDGYTYAELKDHVDLLRRELLLCTDVGKISIYGDRREVIHVELSRAKLAQLGVSPQVIHATLAGQNLVAPAGRVEVGTRYLRIQPTGDFTSVEDIGNLLLLQDDATTSRLYLRDVATITRDYADPPTAMLRFNGRPAIGLGISTVLGGNVVTMGRAVGARLAELEAETPIGIELGVIAHQSTAVTTAVRSFVVSLIEAIAIVVAVLMIAMGLRSGLLIGLILLLTVLGTFILMSVKGIMLERISLGALIIALGMLVDNAIVVVEGILINQKRGMSPVQAATAIVKQTTWPLFGATVVAVLAFAAIGVSQDSTGEYCRSLFLVILYSLTLSWVLAITVTPLFGVMFLKTDTKPGEEDRDPYGGILFRIYRGLLRLCLRSRGMTILCLIVMLAMAVRGFGYVKQSFFPPSTRPQAMVHFWFPQGTHIDRTLEAMQELEVAVRDIDGVTDVAAFVGQGAMRFLLTYAPEERNTSYGMLLISVDDYHKIDNLIAKVAEHGVSRFPDAQVFGRKFVLGPGEAQKIHARFRGPDPAVLRRLAEAARTIMLDEPLATDIMDDWRSPVPVVKPIVAENQARNAGITRSDIAETLQIAFDGAPIGVYREGDKMLPIVARSPAAERGNVANLHDVQIWSPVAGKAIPLSQVVLGFETAPENTIVRRRDRLPTITVKCDPRVGEAMPVFEILRPRIEGRFAELRDEWHLAGYSLEWGGEYESSHDAQGALAGKLPVVGLLMVLIVIVLFNSIRRPLIIFLTVPLAVIGVTAGLLITRQPFGFMALLGFLSLTGMLIKNAIVLIDEIVLQLASDKTPLSAIIDSGVSRVRPVSMAALTTVLGMTPLVADPFFAAMAVTIMFGLAFATLLTLVVVPMLYTVFYRVSTREA